MTGSPLVGFSSYDALFSFLVKSFNQFLVYYLVAQISGFTAGVLLNGAMHPSYPGSIEMFSMWGGDALQSYVFGASNSINATPFILPAIVAAALVFVFVAILVKTNIKGVESAIINATLVGLILLWGGIFLHPVYLINLVCYLIRNGLFNFATGTMLYLGIGLIVIVSEIVGAVLGARLARYLFITQNSTSANNP